MWLFCHGLKHCGPVRAILVEASQVALVAAVALPLRGRVRGSWRRGLALLLLALVLLLGTHGAHPHRARRVANDDGESDGAGAGAGAGAGVGAGDWLGWWWPTHVVGEMALLVASVLMAVHQRAARPLAREMGGPRRLFTATVVAAALLCALPAAWHVWLAGAAERAGYLAHGAAWRCILFAVLSLAGSHRAQLASVASHSASHAAVAALTASYLTACALDWWRGEHAARAHTWVAALCLIDGTRQLLEIASFGSRDGAHLLPYSAVTLASAAGLASAAEKVRDGSRDAAAATAAVFDGEEEDAKWRAATSARAALGGAGLLGFGRAAVRVALATPTSRRLCAYLGLNGAFMVLEATLGLLTGSLTLTTDAAHMLLDCVALAVGLYGEAAARLPPSAAHPFGFARYKTLCALANALLLLLVAGSVAAEALHRLAAPPLIDDARLLPVAVGGLAVNLVGLVYFHDYAHGHGGGTDGCGVECGGCGPADGPVGGPADGEPAGGGGPAVGSGGNDNMRAVFLHVLADTMGSAAAIASSLLARHLGWRLADPLCSLLVAGCIGAVAWPLLRESSTLLLLRTPERLRAGGLKRCLAAVEALPHVKQVTHCRVWSHTRSRALGTVGVVAVPGASERLVATRVASTLRGFGVHATTVQVSTGAPQGDEVEVGRSDDIAMHLGR